MENLIREKILFSAGVCRRSIRTGFWCLLWCLFWETSTICHLWWLLSTPISYIIRIWGWFHEIIDTPSLCLSTQKLVPLWSMDLTPRKVLIAVQLQPSNKTNTKCHRFGGEKTKNMAIYGWSCWIRPKIFFSPTAFCIKSKIFVRNFDLI